MALNKTFRYCDYKQMQNDCLLKKTQEQKKTNKKNQSTCTYKKYIGLSSPRPETLLHSVPKRLTKIFR